MGATPATATMRAAVATSIPSERLELADVARPTPEADDDVVLRVHACGICGTDLHVLAGESYRPETPFVLGHEPVGVVVDAGAGARAWLDRRATITLFTGEGSCEACRAGDERLCPGLVSITGVLGEWGGYAEYLRVKAHHLVEVPESLSWADAASLVDGGATAANSVRVALTREPRRVLVLGGGPIGHLCAELLRVHGVAVQVVEPNPLRREVLRDIGHDVVTSAEDAGAPVDAVIDCTGVPSVLAPGLQALGPHGTYVLAGYARVPDVDFAVVSRKEADIRGIRSGRREDLESIIALAADQRIRLPETVAWRLSGVNDALTALRARQVPGKAVIVPDSVWKDGA
ncbi:alcohol dehydrogenase catalytic domain-containing protein [Nonomuraea aridisoli]|uniref:alcohol dehydrogenase catalytic domain-containing protein n=1 Tax=Nonomuraea aridisoli TaxID=2070368 RepID=UPI0015E8E68A|nr:alcohol dehydrogenase catalytic domain-containing protein [Nonomuraea aridisoli]